MLNILQNIKGDKAIWAIAALLALFSFLPVYSASSNLVYVVGNGTTVGHLVKHAVLLFLGFGIIYGIHKIPTHFFKGLSMIALPIVLVLLVFLLAQGSSGGGTNDSRWIRIPLVGFGFQPSNLAAVVLMIYVARYFSKVRDIKITFKESILPLWLPVFLVVMLILPANFSTAAIIFLMVMILCFLGGYPMKYLLGIVGAGVLFLSIFILTAKAFPDLFPNRVDTWMSRIDSFSNPDDTEANYQIERAKIAIATGGIVGKGAGKSIQKNFLPQSSSDFIYAIIVEPLISSGGTSSWMTCLAIGIILSASNKSIVQESTSAHDIDETNPLEILSGQL